MRYLSVSDVVTIHRVAVGDEQGPIINFGMLEAAVMRPQQSVGGQDAYPDIHHKAAALLHSLCRNHAFLDGNKRTGLLAVATFYGLNDYHFVAEEGELVGLIVDVAESQLDVTAIAGELKGYAIPIEYPDNPRGDPI
jgi:death on curing protein